MFLLHHRAIECVFAARMSRQIHIDPPILPQQNGETAPQRGAKLSKGIQRSEVSAKSQILWSKALAIP